jgi:hypothetical protein
MVLRKTQHKSSNVKLHHTHNSSVHSQVHCHFNADPQYNKLVKWWNVVPLSNGPKRRSKVNSSVCWPRSSDRPKVSYWGYRTAGTSNNIPPHCFASLQNIPLECPPFTSATLYSHHFLYIIRGSVPDKANNGNFSLRATGWTIGVLRFDSLRGLGIFLLITASIPALVPTQPPIQWVPRALSMGGKGTGAWSWPPHLVSRSKHEWSYTSTPPISFHGVVLSLKTSQEQIYRRFQTGSGVHQANLTSGYRGYSGWGANLTAHLHLAPRLRMHGAIPPLLQSAFMAWCSVKHVDNFTI